MLRLSGTPELGSGLSQTGPLSRWLCWCFQSPCCELLQGCPSGTPTHQNPFIHPKWPRLSYFCYIVTRFQTKHPPQQISCRPHSLPTCFLLLAPLRTKPHQHRPGTRKVPLSWFSFCWSHIHPMHSSSPPELCLNHVTPCSETVWGSPQLPRSSSAEAAQASM